jgi:4,5-dihydroxyphthalate decarboxylase
MGGGMGALRVVFAGGDYDHTRAFADGTIRPEAVDLTYVHLPTEETFWRMQRYQDFDASELGMSGYIGLVARGDCPFVAIPAFVSRTFRHGCLFVNSAAGIQAPADLRGKRVGLPNYGMAAALWIRGMLQHDHGVRPADIEWVQAGLREPGRQQPTRYSLPAEISLRSVMDRPLDQMLVTGEIDALMTARMPPSFLSRDPRVRRLFPDYKEVEQDYYRRTGFFPIMHCVVLRRSLYEAHPWVAPNLLRALEASKQWALERAYDYDALRYPLPWLVPDMEEVRQLMGHDPWPYGVEPNRATLEAMCQYAQEQGLTQRRVAVEELFAPNTLEAFRV